MSYGLEPMDENNKNFILAITLSIGVLFFWQYFYAGPMQQEELKRQKELAAARKANSDVQKPGVVPNAKGQSKASSSSSNSASGIPIQAPVKKIDRKSVIASSKRVLIDTQSLSGSISLKGLRIDDLTLRKYRVSVDKNSKNVTLLSPSGSPKPYYAEYGWIANAGENIKLPNSETVWTLVEGTRLTSKTPLKFAYDNGEGLIFKRTISIDDNYMFAIKQEVENKTKKSVTLYPYALISRHGTPELVFDSWWAISYEGLLAVIGGTEHKIPYSSAKEDGQKKIDHRAYKYENTGGWLSITDKFWAAAIIPNQKEKYVANISGPNEKYQMDYRLGGIEISAGKSSSVLGHLFAGAKQTNLIDSYIEKYDIQKFNLMIDWGLLWFLTQPMFYVLDYFFKLFGNYGVSILFVTILIKLIMFPLANKSYESMSRMKKLHPEMTRIRERFKDDRMRQQQEMMELYKKEKINPMAGCLPIFVQIPVFFALYKVLFVTIDMRHAPFFGWIQDLSAPDPTNIFNLFGLIPIELPFPFHVGVWAILMGITMWVQMKLNPPQADPVQQAIFNWMPVAFTFMLATFPAGLVIYWAWNNLLSVIQQWYIMAKNDVEVNLFENMGLDKAWNFFKSYTNTKKT